MGIITNANGINSILGAESTLLSNKHSPFNHVYSDRGRLGLRERISKSNVGIGLKVCPVISEF